MEEFDHCSLNGDYCTPDPSTLMSSTHTTESPLNAQGHRPLRCFFRKPSSNNSKDGADFYTGLSLRDSATGSLMNYNPSDTESHTNRRDSLKKCSSLDAKSCQKRESTGEGKRERQTRHLSRKEQTNTQYQSLLPRVDSNCETTSICNKSITNCCPLSPLRISIESFAPMYMGNSGDGKVMRCADEDPVTAALHDFYSSEDEDDNKLMKNNNINNNTKKYTPKGPSATLREEERDMQFLKWFGSGSIFQCESSSSTNLGASVNTALTTESEEEPPLWTGTCCELWLMKNALIIEEIAHQADVTKESLRAHLLQQWRLSNFCGSDRQLTSSAANALHPSSTLHDNSHSDRYANRSGNTVDALNETENTTHYMHNIGDTMLLSSLKKPIVGKKGLLSSLDLGSKGNNDVINDLSTPLLAEDYRAHDSLNSSISVKSRDYKKKDVDNNNSYNSDIVNPPSGIYTSTNYGDLPIKSALNRNSKLSSRPTSIADSAGTITTRISRENVEDASRQQYTSDGLLSSIRADNRETNESRWDELVDVAQGIGAGEKENHDGEVIEDNLKQEKNHQRSKAVRFGEIQDVRVFEVDNSIYIRIQYARPVFGWALLVIGLIMRSIENIINVYKMGHDANSVYGFSTGYAIGGSATCILFVLPGWYFLWVPSNAEKKAMMSKKGVLLIIALAVIHVLLVTASQSVTKISSQCRNMALFAVHPSVIVLYGFVFKNSVFVEEMIGAFVLFIGFCVAMIPSDIKVEMWIFGEVLSLAQSIYMASFLFLCVKARAQQVSIAVILTAISLLHLIIQLLICVGSGVKFNRETTSSAFEFAISVSSLTTWVTSTFASVISLGCFLGAIRFIPPLTVSTTLVIEQLLSQLMSYILFFNKRTSIWDLCEHYRHDAHGKGGTKINHNVSIAPNGHGGGRTVFHTHMNQRDTTPLHTDILHTSTPHQTHNAGLMIYCDDDNSFCYYMFLAGTSMCLLAGGYLIYISSIKRCKVELLLEKLSRRKRPKNPYDRSAYRRSSVTSSHSVNNDEYEHSSETGEVREVTPGMVQNNIGPSGHVRTFSTPYIQYRDHLRKQEDPLAPPLGLLAPSTQPLMGRYAGTMAWFLQQHHQKQQDRELEQKEDKQEENESGTSVCKLI